MHIKYIKKNLEIIMNPNGEEMSFQSDMKLFLFSETLLTQDVILTLIQRFLNVMDTNPHKWPLKLNHLFQLFVSSVIQSKKNLLLGPRASSSLLVFTTVLVIIPGVPKKSTPL